MKKLLFSFVTLFLFSCGELELTSLEGTTWKGTHKVSYPEQAEYWETYEISFTATTAKTKITTTNDKAPWTGEEPYTFDPPLVTFIGTAEIHHSDPPSVEVVEVKNFGTVEGDVLKYQIWETLDLRNEVKLHLQ